MADADGKVRRVLVLKVTLPSADPAYVRTVVQATAPFYSLLGGTSIRLLRNVDDPAQFIQEIAYEAPEALELSRQRIASDLRIQSFLQAWRQMLGGAIEVEVYEDLTAAS
ncbi:hypothetical protein RHODGE_RHODGE_03270 [Rhodoplanes serenus]|uniref:ABM domain-containing protein n=1 Tax=Rhodoplanes serenus TaxID=200615 RepID=A0A327K5S5_9BRAD|nr:hypothetical protein CH340_20795 [Rhodoplanes serenus]VCU10084.1 hypothetical protein RHODGE_RHODGE_03270 [Rhodoplanes serenus]